MDVNTRISVAPAARHGLANEESVVSIRSSRGRHVRGEGVKVMKTDADGNSKRCTLSKRVGGFSHRLVDAYGSSILPCDGATVGCILTAGGDRMIGDVRSVDTGG